MASFTHDIHSTRPTRPSFSSQLTSDRQRDSDRRRAIISTNSITREPQAKRISVFKELGLDDLNTSVHRSRDGKSHLEHAHLEHKAKGGARDTSDDPLDSNAPPRGDKIQERENGHQKSSSRSSASSSWYNKIVKGRPPIVTTKSAPSTSMTTMPRVALIAFVCALVVPGFHYVGERGEEKVNIAGAEAGVIREMGNEMVAKGVHERQNSPADYCTRWAHQGMYCFV